MSADDSHKRYDEILKKIARRRPFGSDPPEEKKRMPQDRALDLLNAYDALAALARRDFRHILCYGPQTARGAAWTGVVIWYQRKGYHGYQTLNLLGVWAQHRAGELAIAIGIRQLPYRAPVYDPGVYRIAIRNNFRIYYDDRGQPPDDGDRLLYRARFEVKRRLEHRQALVDSLESWRGEIEAL